MPFIGSSYIKGNYASGGLTGLTGITGNTGNIGPVGLTAGNTGATGTWLSNIISVTSLDQLTFAVTDGSSYTLSGFTGATGYWFNSVGVSAEIGNTAHSPFFRVNGKTFEFRGISAGNNATITADDAFVYININTSGGAYGLSGAIDYIPVVSGNTLAATLIYADSNNALNFGLTGMPVGTPTIKPVFTDLKENVTVISSLDSSDPSGGYELDLSQSSVYWLNTPVGITSFINGITASGVRQEYTFFINGPVVWNLPKNLYFGNDEYAGIKNARLLNGINILQIWSDNGGNTFNASVISRGIGVDNKFNRAEWGSCCQSGTCSDNVLVTDCLSGTFKSLISCSNRTDCASFTFTESVITGACCCGITGCIDSTNAPAGVLVTETWCNGICGSFKPDISGGTPTRCAPFDKYPVFQTRTVSFGNEAIGNYPSAICPNGCADPVTCCAGDIATQETDHYCTAVLGGEALYGKTVAQIQSEGGCASLLELGVCRSGGLCNEDIKKYNCNCGVFYTGTDALSTCEADLIAGGGDSSVSLNTTATQPEIKVYHSVNSATNTQTYITYNNFQDDPDRTQHLQYELTTPGSVVQKYLISGSLNILDENTPTNIDIWNPTSCIGITLYNAAGDVMTSNTILTAPTTFTVELNINTSSCITQFGGDVDFSGVLDIAPVSCSTGILTDKTKSVPFSYTRSPCKCLKVGDANSGITGDIINKLAITIPYTATRYCTHCTNAQIGAQGDNEYIAHIPYPLKTQTGFISFCPPTTIQQGQECALPEYWCIYYGRINELSGCTYSSLFDMNNDLIVIPGSRYTKWDGSPTTVPETNIAPPGCYHIEYNEINILDNASSGTTYWFTGEWDYDDFESVSSKGTRGNIRTCDPTCRIKVPPYYCANSTENDNTALCTGDSVSSACKTCPGYPKFTGLPEWDPLNDDFCLDYQPYFNIIRFDPDVLNNIAKVYGYNVSNLQQQLTSQILNYGSRGTNPVPYNQGNLFNPLKQETQDTISGAPDPLPGVDPDQLATNSCSACPSRFDNNLKIQIPYDAPNFSSQTFDVYGIVIAKETACVESGGYSSGRTDSCPAYDEATGKCSNSGGKVSTTLRTEYGGCDTMQTTWFEYKYFIIVVQDKNDGTDKNMNIFDIGSTTELIRNNNWAQYEANCGGGSMLCDTDCGNGAILKEVKWFGTLTNSVENLLTGFCDTSKRINYTITKKLEGVVPAGTGLHSLNSIINFAANNINYSAPLESGKLGVLAEMVSNIFGKEKTDDYLGSLYTVCSTEDGSSSCTVNIVPEMIEFIGKDCYVQGFESGGFISINLQYDNTNNQNKITLIKNGSPQSVYWLREHETSSSSSSQDGSFPWLLFSSATMYLHNFFTVGTTPTNMRSKYIPFNNADRSTPTTSLPPSEQSFGLQWNTLDNRWLKNYNVSYLEIKDGFIAKRKVIYEPPTIKGITVSTVVYNTASGKTGPMKVGSSISGDDSVRFTDWNIDSLYFSDKNPSGSATMNIPSTGRIVNSFLPKIDLNGLRPVTKIEFAKIVIPNRNEGQRGYQLLVKFGGIRTGGGKTNVGYLKFLYKDSTNTIVDVTPLIYHSMSLDNIFGFMSFNSSSGAPTANEWTWSHDRSEYWITIPDINNQLSTNNANGNFAVVREATGYLFHSHASFPAYFCGINTSSSNPRELPTHWKTWLATNTEFCDNPSNCADVSITLDTLVNSNPPTSPTGLASLFQQGKIYILLKEEYKPNLYNNSIFSIFKNYYKNWSNIGLIPKRISTALNGDDFPASRCFAEQSELMNDITQFTDISLCDFALARVLPISSTSDIESIQSIINNNIRSVKVDGSCLSIDCTNIPDMCNELESC
jgi:hypothetical protein